jgi:hypothetical protein
MAVLSVLVAFPVATCGGIITIPAPDLLGKYDCPESSSFYSRQTTLEWPYDCAKVRLIVRGILTAGLVRGDGITRAAQEAALMGTFLIGFTNLWDVGEDIHGEYIGPPGPGSVPFTMQTELPGPWSISASEDKPAALFTVSLATATRANPVPWLVEQPDAFDFYGWDQGLELVTPLTATITEAYWELEGPTIPEPATLSLLALGGLAILRRREAGVRKTR